MLFDTDVLIWAQRKHRAACKAVYSIDKRYISIQTYMELLQQPQKKKQHDVVKNFLMYASFKVLPLTEEIGHRALIYIEEYSLSIGIQAVDAIIASTAVENNLPLITGNKKHFKSISELRLKAFKP